MARTKWARAETRDSEALQEHQVCTNVACYFILALKLVTLREPNSNTSIACATFRDM